MEMLRRVMLSGFKSIKSMDLELRPLNVLIGANGAGKSNLISFFKLLNEMMAGRLQLHIATTGRAHSLLHFGPKVTSEIEARLQFETVEGVNTYEMTLEFAVGDILVCSDEKLSQNLSSSELPYWSNQFSSASNESRINEVRDLKNTMGIRLRQLMNN